jgi:cytochrome c biogenesis protein CcmG/thiol:disulfide interchange protein DsbE
MRRLRLFLWGCVVVAAALFGLFAWQLSRPKDDLVRSEMIGKPLPQFALPASIPERPGLSSADFVDGKPKLLNVFASWCVPCAVEAPQLAALVRAGAPIVAVAVRDRPEDLAVFFARYGNPFSRVGADNVRTVQFLLGSSGVPETFVVDGRGVIRHQHIGEIRPEDVPELLAELRDAA